jgi:hypothetical protein
MIMWLASLSMALSILWNIQQAWLNIHYAWYGTCMSDPVPQYWDQGSVRCFCVCGWRYVQQRRAFMGVFAVHLFELAAFCASIRHPPPPPSLTFLALLPPCLAMEAHAMQPVGQREQKATESCAAAITLQAPRRVCLQFPNNRPPPGLVNGQEVTVQGYSVPVANR